MVLYLGYAALALIGLYFTVGILKISGEGLAKLGYENNFIQEGFSDKQEEAFGKKIKNILKGKKDNDVFDEKRRDEIDGINDLDGYDEVVEMMKQNVDTQIRSMLQQAILNNGINDEKTMKPIRDYKQIADLLENYTL